MAIAAQLLRDPGRYLQQRAERDWPVATGVLRIQRLVLWIKENSMVSWNPYE
jgi:hypothetical protein